MTTYWGRRRAPGAVAQTPVEVIVEEMQTQAQALAETGSGEWIPSASLQICLLFSILAVMMALQVFVYCRLCKVSDTMEALTRTLEEVVSKRICADALMDARQPTGPDACGTMFQRRGSSASLVSSVTSHFQRRGSASSVNSVAEQQRTEPAVLSGEDCSRSLLS